jgi:malic enzyme
MMAMPQFATTVTERGAQLLQDPRLNKSTAFTEAEREALALIGLVPEAIDAEDTQVQRVMQHLGHKPTDLERYIYLIGLLDTDETLFYRVLMSDPVRFLPIVYDPTVGEACLKFGINGLIESSRTDLFDFQKPYAHPHAPTNDFISAIKSIAPTAIIGVSTKGKTFNRQVIEAMARISERPIVFALSNPTDKAECSAQEAYTWSQGRAVFAAGVPFPPVRFDGKTFVPGQGNNLYIFPAVSLAVYTTQANRVTDEMFIAAASGVAEQVTREELDSGLLYPPQTDILQTELHAAQRVAEVIFDRGLARVDKPKHILAFVESHVYRPEYRGLVQVAASE